MTRCRGHHKRNSAVLRDSRKRLAQSTPARQGGFIDFLDGVVKDDDQTRNLLRLLYPASFAILTFVIALVSLLPGPELLITFMAATAWLLKKWRDTARRGAKGGRSPRSGG